LTLRYSPQKQEGKQEEKRRKPYFRFDARAAFEVTMVTG
jgi:hypothetical protein